MKSVMPDGEKWPGHEAEIGKSQDEYSTLMARVTDEGAVISTWELDEEEVMLLVQGKQLVLVQWTFGALFQPISVFVEDSAKHREMDS